MNLNELEKMWEEDSKMDPDNLHLEAVKIPQLHGKYYEIQNKIYALKKTKECEYNALYKEKFMFYTGKDLNGKKFDYKILKAEVPIFLESDEELIKLKAKVDYCTYLLNYVADILKMLHNRSFQIRDAIEWCKFSAGMS